MRIPPRIALLTIHFFPPSRLILPVYMYINIMGRAMCLIGSLQDMLYGMQIMIKTVKVNIVVAMRFLE